MGFLNRGFPRVRLRSFPESLDNLDHGGLQPDPLGRPRESEEKPGPPILSSSAVSTSRISSARCLARVFFMISARWVSTVLMLISNRAAMFLFGDPKRSAPGLPA